MITNCPVCGKAFDVAWPHLWRYRRGQIFICSWKCLRENDKGKEAGDMAYSKIKKDGTPAKIPGRKKKEEPKVELVYDPSIAEEYRREQAQKKEYEEVRRAGGLKLPEPDYQKYEKTMITKQMLKIQGQEPLEVCGVRSRVLKDGVYTRNTAGNAMILSGLSMADDHLGLKAENWIRLSAEILLALEQLQVRAEDPEDRTGNNGPL